MRSLRIARMLPVIALALAACSVGPPGVPALQPEAVPLPPVSPVEQIWRPGSWNWDGSGYRWQPGEYVPREPWMSLWRYGSWQRDSSGWAWQPPGWVRTP